MTKKINIAIQGYQGSFHEQAADEYFGDQISGYAKCNNFLDLAQALTTRKVNKAVMAIENSIAGSILQNYRLLRENSFWIEGEIYLKISHQLLANPNSVLSAITKVYSHPMALNQCLPFLRSLDDVKLVEADDTALSAIYLSNHPNPKHACIASKRAGEITGLQTLVPNIESDKHNYTRFFILSKDKINNDEVNKASFYIKIPDKKGELLKALVIIDTLKINMSKLQSFPVLGMFREYFFHIDVEFDTIDQYREMKQQMIQLGFHFEEMGLYKRADLEFLTSQTP